MPYTLDWESCAIEVARPHRLAIRATGDFIGRGIWTIQQAGSFVDAAIDWKMTANKHLLRYSSFLLRPVFEANHRWAMQRGREGLEQELKCRSNLTHG